MTNVFEQWGRVVRYRARYVAAAASAPAGMMSVESIPEDRQAEVRSWANELQDSGISCCQNLHHLKDWIKRDPKIPASNTEVESVISESVALRTIADICNGTKHAILTRPRSDLVDPTGTSRRIRLSSGGASGWQNTAATLIVELDNVDVPLLEVIDEAIHEWGAFLDRHGVHLPA